MAFACQKIKGLLTYLLTYFSGVATERIGGRVPHFPKEQFWDLSKSDKKSVRLPEWIPLSAFGFG